MYSLTCIEEQLWDRKSQVIIDATVSLFVIYIEKTTSIAKSYVNKWKKNLGFA